MRFGGLTSAIVSIAAFTVLWELFGSIGQLPTAFSIPSLMTIKFVELVTSMELLVHTSVTLQELGIAFFLAMIVGIPIGLGMGRIRMLEYGLDPYVTIILSMPKIVLWPMIIFVFGLGITSKIVVAFLLAVFPLIVNVMNGVKNIDPLLIDVAKSFNTKQAHLFRKIILPASMPNITAGLQISFGRCVTGVILGEVFGAYVGLGKMISDAGEVFEFGTVFVGAITLVLIGLVGTEGLGRLRSRLVPWSRD